MLHPFTCPPRCEARGRRLSGPHGSRQGFYTLGPGACLACPLPTPHGPGLGGEKEAGVSLPHTENMPLDFL